MSIKNLLANIYAINVHMKIIDLFVNTQTESIKFMTVTEYGREDVNVRYVMNRSLYGDILPLSQLIIL